MATERPLARVGLAGAEIGLSSINRKVGSMPPCEEENDSSCGLFTLCEPDQPTVPELEYICPSPILLKARTEQSC